ncbi:MAG: diguanylate cyclase, partial [Candidatus Izemoplasmatales bacterium]
MKFIKKPMILATIYLIISFATLSYFFFMSYQLVEDKQKEVLLVELENTSQEINENFLEIDTMIKTLESYLNLDTSDGELLDLLVDIDQKHESVASIYLGKPDKSMVNSSGFVPGPDFDLTTRIWYRSAIASEDTIFTPAFVNATNDRVIVTAAKAIYDQDTLIGVLAVDIDVRTIAAFVSEKEIGDNGYAILMDSNNHLIAYPGMDLSIVELKELVDFEENLLTVSNEGTYEDFYMSNEQGVLSVGNIESNNYRLFVFLPQSEFALSLIFVSRLFIILAIIMLLIAAIVLLIYNFRVKKPLDLLLTDIDRIDVSKTRDYRLPKLQKDDYDHIRNALNKVLESTDLFFQERQEAQYQLSIENQRVKLLMESATDIIFEIDKDRRYVSIFGRGLNLLQLNASDFIGKTVVEVFGEKSIERDKIYEDALKGKHRVYDWEYQIDGLTLYFESSISPIFDESKNIIGVVGITRDITEPMQKQREIEYISIHDFLTGIYNRRYFVEAFMKYDHPNYYPLGLMMVDLNGLKILNDAYGHDKGDIALKEVARVLNEETQKDDIVCRIGGDEFAVIFIKTQVLILDKIKENIGRKLSQVYVENIPLSVAVGYEVKVDEVRTFEEIMKNAENQMYRNKLKEGKSIRNNSIKAILKTLTDKFEEEK